MKTKISILQPPADHDLLIQFSDSPTCLYLQMDGDSSDEKGRGQRVRGLTIRMIDSSEWVKDNLFSWQIGSCFYSADILCFAAMSNESTIKFLKEF